MCLCQRGRPAFLLVPPSATVHPAAVAAAWSGMLSAGTKKCNWRNFPASFFGEPFEPRKAIERGKVRSILQRLTHLDVEDIAALDRLADDAGPGQAGVRHLQRPQAGDHLLVGVVLAHVDAEAVHPGARRLGRPRRWPLLLKRTTGR